jgi:hypothetical protein
MVVLDRLRWETTTWLTPDVRTVPVDPARLAMFENDHLRAIGKPASEISREISERQAQIKERYFKGHASTFERQGRQHVENQWGNRI